MNGGLHQPGCRDPSETFVDLSHKILHLRSISDLYHFSLDGTVCIVIINVLFTYIVIHMVRNTWLTKSIEISSIRNENLSMVFPPELNDHQCNRLLTIIH